MAEDETPIEASRLLAFRGEWVVAGTLDAEGARSAVSGRWRFESAADGWGVRGRMKTEIEGIGAFEEDELIGFDASAGVVHLFSLNKFAVRDHVGGWLSDDTLEVEFVDVQDGKRIIETISIRFVSSTQLVGHVTEQSDGVVAVTTDLSLTKT